MTAVLVAVLRQKGDPRAEAGSGGTRRAPGCCLSYDVSLPLWLLLHPVRKRFEAVVGSVKPGFCLKVGFWGTL